jgi:hypothetical protein
MTRLDEVSGEAAGKALRRAFGRATSPTPCFEPRLGRSSIQAELVDGESHAWASLDAIPKVLEFLRQSLQDR